jgi:hypothetical protein
LYFVSRSRQGRCIRVKVGANERRLHIFQINQKEYSTHEGDIRYRYKKKLGKGKREERTRSEATETGRVDKTNVDKCC